MKSNKKLLFFPLLAILLLFVCLSLSLVKFASYDYPPDYPPLICIDGVTFKGNGLSLSQLPSGSVYLGDVTSSVPSNKIPSENFQANDDIVGAEIYQADDSIMIYHNHQWWIYD